MEASLNISLGEKDITNGSDNPFVVSLMTVFVALVVVIGSVGNLLTVYTILRVKRLQTTANALVASLALTDTCTVLISIPLLFSRFRFMEFHEEHRTICKASFYSLVTFIAISVNSLQVIAANRYFIITQPRHTYLKYWGRFGTGIIIAFVWVYSIFLVCLPFFGFGEIDFIPELGGCGIVETNRQSWWYKTLLLLTVFESCGIATPIFFILTFKKIRSAKLRLQSTRSAANMLNTQSKPKGFSREEIAVTKMTALVFFCFLLCWSPYFILHLSTIGKVKPGGLTAFCLIFAFSNSVFNPLIYAGMNKNFRRAFSLKYVCHPERLPANTTTVVVASIG
ncbi:melatonin receptor type 1B-like [Apostichopus japonicus]|uniref:melatonin receptor type 1B-like n=1 Tax=Stichopus japonicus TaxID=307972 RepID=UPI003AB4FCCB